MSSTIKSGALLGIGTLLAAFAIAGCSTDEPGTVSRTDEQPGTASSGLSIPAGERSRTLGITTWRLDDGGLIKGLGSEGQLIAEFKSHRDRRAITSLIPEGGTMTLGQEGASDTLTPASRQYYELLIDDMTAAPAVNANEGDRSSNGIGVAVQSVWYGPLACCYANVYANYYYWYDGGYTQYCHLDVYTDSCSGLTSCFDYGYATGCLYWI